MGDLLKQAAKEVLEVDDIRKQMKKLGNVFLGAREVSAQEAAYRALSFPLQKRSRQVIFLNTGMPEERIKLVKSSAKLKSLDPGSEDVFEKNITNRYAARPTTLEDMCLVKFAGWYRNSGSASHKDESEDDSDTEDDGAGRITLRNNMGSMSKRKCMAVLRTPKFSLTRTPEKFYHCILMYFMEE